MIEIIQLENTRIEELIGKACRISAALEVGSKICVEDLSQDPEIASIRSQKYPGPSIKAFSGA